MHGIEQAVKDHVATGLTKRWVELKDKEADALRDEDGRAALNAHVRADELGMVALRMDAVPEFNQHQAYAYTQLSPFTKRQLETKHHTDFLTVPNDSNEQIEERRIRIESRERKYGWR